MAGKNFMHMLYENLIRKFSFFFAKAEWGEVLFFKIFLRFFLWSPSTKNYETSVYDKLFTIKIRKFLSTVYIIFGLTAPQTYNF